MSPNFICILYEYCAIDGVFLMRKTKNHLRDQNKQLDETYIYRHDLA